MFERKRTPYEIIYYAVYLAFQGLSFEKCAKAIEPLIKRTPKAVWDWSQALGQDKGISKIFRLGEKGSKYLKSTRQRLRLQELKLGSYWTGIRTVRAENSRVIFHMATKQHSGGDVPQTAQENVWQARSPCIHHSESQFVVTKESNGTFVITPMSGLGRESQIPECLPNSATSGSLTPGSNINPLTASDWLYGVTDLDSTSGIIGAYLTYDSGGTYPNTNTTLSLWLGVTTDTGYFKWTPRGEV